MSIKRLASVSLVLLILSACVKEDSHTSRYNVPPPADPPPLLEDGTEGPHKDKSPVLTWDTVPVPYEILAPIAFTLPSGETHWYEVVFLPEGGVNWVQASGLAKQRGGYLLSLHSQEENDFAFSLVTEDKYWWKFSHGFMDDGTPLLNLSGPFLGGFQVSGSEEPDGGWRWVSGEAMTWTNWQHEDLDIGINIPPDNQPNNSGGQQNVMAFGEVDVVASYWSDVPHMMGTFGTPLPSAFGFIIEYDSDPR